MTSSGTSAQSTSPNDHTLGNVKVGARVSQIRRAAGLSQGQLAELASPFLEGATEARQGWLTREAVCRIESARRAFKYSEAVAIANALEIDILAFSSEAAAEGATIALIRRAA